MDHYESYGNHSQDYSTPNQSPSKRKKLELSEASEYSYRSETHGKFKGERNRMYRVEFETDDHEAIVNPYNYIKESIHIPSTASYTCAVVETGSNPDKEACKIIATHFFRERKGPNSPYLQLPKCIQSSPINYNRKDALLLPTDISDHYKGPFMYGSRPGVRDEIIPSAHSEKNSVIKSGSCKTYTRELVTTNEQNQDVLAEIAKSRDMIIESINKLKSEFPDSSLQRENKMRLPLFLPNVWGIVMPNTTAHLCKCNYWIYSETMDLQNEFGELLVAHFNVEYYNGSVMDKSTEGIIVKDNTTNAQELSILCNKMIYKYGTSFYLLIVVLSTAPLFHSPTLINRFNEINLDLVLGKKDSQKDNTKLMSNDILSKKPEAILGKLKVLF